MAHRFEAFCDRLVPSTGEEGNGRRCVGPGMAVFRLFMKTCPGARCARAARGEQSGSPAGPRICLSLVQQLGWRGGDAEDAVQELAQA